MNFMELLFLILWSMLGLSYFVYLWLSSNTDELPHQPAINIPNKDKLRLVVLFSGPCVWILMIINFMWSAIKPVFKAIDGWVKKE